MNPVLLNSEDRGHSFHSFYEKFMEICKEHKENDCALAFAFILYDFENPQISKVLQDQDYWLGLNAISGKYLTVFSLHHKPKIKYKRKSDPTIFQYMTKIRHFDNPSECSNSLIEKYFGNGIEVKYPSVLFFQIHQDKIIDYILIELDAQEIESSFLELKNYISEAVESLKLIADEYKGNSKEIFEQLKLKVKGQRSRIVIKKNAKKLTSIVELGSSIVGLGG